MPFVDVKVSVALDEPKKAALAQAVVKIAGKALGKGDSWVMTNIEGSKYLYFQGSAEPCAYINVSLYGSASSAGASELTQKLTQTVTQQLGIPAGRVFISYFGTQQWGFNGQNF